MLASISIGDLLDSKYRVVKRLGGGGFGDVYLAEDELLGRQVAMKVLKGRDSRRQTDLVHEMWALDHLHHPNVVTFYHHFVTQGQLFLVMEYCAGGSLRKKMGQHALPTHEALQLARDLAETLRFVHSHGIVHHDIKPDNILFAADGSLKIGDFGVANRNFGTLPYMAPEVFLGEVDTQDLRFDVYALGITLLELLLRRDPFQGMEPPEMLRSKMRHDFVPGDLDRWVQEVVFKATHPTPELRFQTMGEFREAIDSEHVSYVFDRNRVRAHALAAKAERLLARRRVTAASTCIAQALFACPDCVAALIAAGRYNLLIDNISEAKRHLDRALSVNPRTNIQKELGWINLEVGNYSQAISLLTDHLQRNAADYEAFNLLLECFYRTKRYEIGLQVAKLMIDGRAPSECFENNGFLCGLFQNSDDPELVERALSKQANPFLQYNLDLVMLAPDRLEHLLLFQPYRFGLPGRKANTLTIQHHGHTTEFEDPLITIGCLEENQICLPNSTVSRRHCAIVNYPDDVWIYDLGSTQGICVDGKRVDRKAYIKGVHVVTLGQVQLTLCSKVGLLL